jgi:hypothetical protein
MSLVTSILGLFPSFIPGPRLIDGGELQQQANLLFSAQTGIVAAAGGGQANATPLTSALNRVDTIATNSDSVMLPPAVPGQQVTVKNNTANTLAIFGQVSNALNANSVGDTIATSQSNTQQPTATGITLATTLTARFICFTAGQWQEFLTA